MKKGVTLRSSLVSVSTNQNLPEILGNWFIKANLRAQQCCIDPIQQLVLPLLQLRHLVEFLIDSRTQRCNKQKGAS